MSLSTAHKNLIQDTLIEMIGQWSGIGAENLEPTSTYGIRAYMNESTLKTHVDRCETHILSAVYYVEDSYPKGVDRWPMVADGDFLGERVSVVSPQSSVLSPQISVLSPQSSHSVRSQISVPFLAMYLFGCSVTNNRR